MRLLVTGGCGFVMSNLVKHILETDNEASALVLDIGTPDALVTDFLSDLSERVAFLEADVREPTILADLSLEDVTHVVHGAAVTNYPRAELDDPARFIEVNVVGTINILQRMARVSSVERVIDISSGAVYGSPTPESPEGPQPEEGPLNPPELYAVSKYTSEMVARRCGELFSIDVRHVRLSDVFGPMERPTSVRQSMSLPYKMMRAVTENRPLLVTDETLAAGGDFISATDVAEAIGRLLRTQNLKYDVYNIAYGTFTLAGELFQAFRYVAPTFTVDVVGAEAADVALDPSRRRARWNTYSTKRIEQDTGWSASDLRQELRRYHDWVRADPGRRCLPYLTLAAGD